MSGFYCGRRTMNKAESRIYMRSQNNADRSNYHVGTQAWPIFFLWGGGKERLPFASVFAMKDQPIPFKKLSKVHLNMQLTYEFLT